MVLKISTFGVWWTMSDIHASAEKKEFHKQKQKKLLELVKENILRQCYF